MERCDVLIVGGGPAGSSCAWLLGRLGMDVLVVEKATFPRDKTCAGWITPPVLEVLEIDADDYRRGRVLQSITGFRTGLIGGRAIDVAYDRVISYGIRRCEFDHYLLRRSQARCRHERVECIERAADGWIVNGEIRAPLIVGAGGHFCPVARLLGVCRTGQRSVVAAQEAEFRADCEQLRMSNIEPEVPEIFFCDDLKGYGWCFRKGEYLNVGVGRVDRHRLSSHVTNFSEFLQKRGTFSGEINAPFRGHAYAVYELSVPPLLDDRALLVGDAAGLAYPQSGEGIRPAVESGLIAADAIVSAGGDYRRRALQAYETRARERFGRPRTKGVSQWVPASWLQWGASRLLATKWFTRRIVLERWFLRTGESPLKLTHG